MADGEGHDDKQERRKSGPPPSAQMSSPDLSKWGHESVDVPSRSGETWIAIGIIVILAFAIGIFFALR